MTDGSSEGLSADGSDADEGPRFERDDAGGSGVLTRISPLVRRLVAGNPSPFTWTGTCTYLVGGNDLAIIDPGPDDDAHRARLLKAIGSARVSHIVVTHTHRDHSPGARPLAAITGAPIVGCGPHRAARPLKLGEMGVLDASADRDHRPHQTTSDGDVIAGDGWTLTAIDTPGHTANHVAFCLAEENALFSGDHVMAWSTSIVAPPDGDMAAYMASLERLKSIDAQIYWPGHGGPVRNPQRFVRALIHHRRQREASILNRIAAGDRTIPAVVAAIYDGLDPRLVGAASLSVLAHLEDLAGRDRVRIIAGHGLGATFAPV